MSLMKSGMNEHAHAETLIPSIDGKIQGFWDSIPVSPATEEVVTGFPDGGEEVYRPEDAFGALLSGQFYFGPCRGGVIFEKEISCFEMFETNAMGSGQDIARFGPCVGRLKIKKVIELRLFKMADVFLGANRRTGFTMMHLFLCGSIRVCAFIPGLILLRGFFSGRISVRLWRAVGIEDKVIDAGYFRELSSE
ncbi:hypothetical protein F2Q70_00029058 [Brassica cretica]|uniref:Uncharacterized protein n=1 Tax=Brassica cretica TaxID=69181 RepID=A0A8S9FLA9_BRACR|nr:hypothetical protein F2Q70_00029058 [Brassica cretica]